jgi:hypothetical protein
MNLKEVTKYKVSTQWAKIAYEFFLTKCWIKYTYPVFRWYLNRLTLKEIIELSKQKRKWRWWGRYKEYNKHLRWYNRYNYWDKVKELAKEYW